MTTRGTTSRPHDPELADEQYQAPFTNHIPEVRGQSEENHRASSFVDAGSVRSTSLFGEQELQEAEQWASQSMKSRTDMIGRSVKKRRDSQVGSYEDPNTIFDGPSAEFVPSSVTSMHHNMARPSLHPHSRRRSQRFHSRISRSGRASSSIQSHSRESRDHSPSSVHTLDSHGNSSISYRKRAYPRRAYRVSEDGASSSVPGSSSLIGSLFATFRVDQAEAEADANADNGRWLDQESDMVDEEALDLDDYDDENEALISDASDRSSADSQPHGSPQNRFIPNVFGVPEPFVDYRAEGPEDGRQDVPFDDPTMPPKPVHLMDYPEAVSEARDGHVHMDAVGNAHAEGYTESPWLDKTCRTKQQIYLADEDTLIRISGYRTRQSHYIMYMAACIFSLGIIGLLSLWFPRWRLRYVYQEADFADAEFVVVENQWGDISKEAFMSVPFARPLKSVFPPTSRDPPCTYAEAQSMLHDAVPDEIRCGHDGEEIVDLLMFEYRYTRFLLHPPTGRFRTIREWRDGKWTSTDLMRQGISTELERERRVFFGLNVIDIAEKSSLDLLISEVLHPFYIFQIVSILLWSLDDYYYYAFCIATISIGSIVSTLFETKKTIARMREMNRFVCSVRVLRDSQWRYLDSSDLMPGDVFDAAEQSLTTVPADCILLSGDAIVNESMLTGESVPISKQPLTEQQVPSIQSTRTDLANHLAKHFLFSGTKIIRTRPAIGSLDPEDISAKAMVVRTGFHTTKGSLVRGMLFPKPMGFKFYRDSFRFIGFLAAIAFVGLCFNTANFIQIGISWRTLAIRVLDLVTVVVPPALPATMSIGTAFAIARLRKLGVFCISPTRVNMGGKVNVVCFDKTGTLTEDGLDVLGTRTVDVHMGQFSELHQTSNELDTASSDPSGRLSLLYALATCHSLKIVHGEVIGDPLDVKMFEYTDWTIDEGEETDLRTIALGQDRSPSLVQTVVRPRDSPPFDANDTIAHANQDILELGVIRTFEFVSALRRMSVIVKQLHSSSMEVFVKGAPEALIDICDRATLPQDFDDLLAYYTHHGFRVIACAGKSLPGLSWVEAQRLPREKAESGLSFLGLIVFENKLKPGSLPAIATLRNANIGCKMVTGDNPRTAVSVARECGILGQSSTVFLPSFVHGSPDEPNDVILSWCSTDDESMKLNPDTLKPINPDPMHIDLGEHNILEYELVITGDVFRWMIDYAPIEIVRRMLIKGTIFARMSPDEKHDMVDRLQELGYTVGMCGDGANDCGALKAADIGISLSEAEASVAAPFTSTRPDISCVIEVIKEGRASLVTSFSCFKYMALYSLIQFTSITILYNLASSLGDFQFLFIDLFIILPVAVAMARTWPYPTLHTKRPTANLLSKKVLLSMLAQVILCSGFQVFVFCLTRRQPWYRPPQVNPDELNVVNAENSALFLVSSFQYITVAAVFSVGPPFRQPIYTNPMLLTSLTVLTCMSMYFLFMRGGFFFELLGLVEFPPSFHWKLFAIVVANTAACFVFESHLMGPTLNVIKFVQRMLFHRGRKHDKTRKHGQKTYKAVLMSLNDPSEA